MWSRVVLRQFVQTGSSKLQFLNTTCSTQAVQYCRLSSKKGPTEWVHINPSIKEEPYKLTPEQTLQITKGDPEQHLKLKELLLKLFIRHELGTELPRSIKVESFEVMLSSGSNQLTRMLKYLVKNSKENDRELLAKARDRLMLEENRSKRVDFQSETAWLDDKVTQNRLFVQIYQRSVAAAYNVNAVKGFQFGQKIIFDCSMESSMWERELRHTVKQILLSYDNGRRSRRPFALHLCNLDFNGKLMQHLERQRPDILELPIGLHADSYLDLFERKKLVYIDQRASKKLEYDPEDIYVLRAVVDRLNSAPRGDRKAMKEKIRFAALPLNNIVDRKAMKEKIRFAALPLNNIVKWKPKVHKYLCLHQFHNMLLDVKNHGNWPEAIAAHLPKSRYDCIVDANTELTRRHNTMGDNYF